MKLPSNFELERYGLHVRLVREGKKEVHYLHKEIAPRGGGEGQINENHI